MKTYPVITWLLHWKQVLPSVVATLLVIAGIWVFVRTGIYESVAAGVIVAAGAYVLVRSYLELVEIIFGHPPTTLTRNSPRRYDNVVDAVSRLHAR